MNRGSAAQALPSHDANRLLAGLALAACGAALFSGKAIVIKLAYRYGADPVTLIALRMAFAVPLFALALAWAGRRASPLEPADHLRLATLGVIGYYAASQLDFLGLQYVTAGLERLVLYLTPTIVMLASALLLKKPVTRRDAAALVLSYGGIALVFRHDVAVSGRQVPLGVGLVFLSAAFYATYLTWSGELVRRIGAIRLTSYAMCAATFASLLQFALLRPWTALRLPAAVYGLSAFNGVACTVVPVFATMMAVERIGAGRTALASNVGPVATIVFGALFLDEAVTSWQLAGTALVLLGVFVLSRRPPAGIVSRLPTPQAAIEGGER